MDLVSKASTFRIGMKTFDLTERTLVMGVLNVTPDSFSDGGQYLAPDDAIKRAEQMIEEGADILDIGGESSRPSGPYGEGAQLVPEEEEIKRTQPVIAAIADTFDVPISIDTVKLGVARAALEAGACAVNDISGLAGDSDMPDLIAKTGASAFIMHMQGTPQTMQKAPNYKDLFGQVSTFLKDQVAVAQRAGIPPDQIAVDPGLGFGKSYDDNYALIRRIPELVELGYPVLMGASRKTFVGLDFSLPPGQRGPGSLAACALCAQLGAHIVRVHDVRASKQALFVADRLNRTA